MSVPFVDLGPVVDFINEDGSFPREVGKALINHDFIGGSRVKALEAELQVKLGVKHAVTCGSGTDALVLALMASGIGRGHYVAVPNLTFWATYEAVVRVGATPVLLDVDEHLQLDLDELRRQHRRFDAVLLVHLFGWTSPRLQEIRDYCQKQRITLIEDGAQAFGASMPVIGTSRSVFEGAHVSTLSFYPAKVIGGIGDGGALLTDSDRVAARARALANHGRSGHYEHAAVGLCSRMSEIEAAWLLRAVDKSYDIIGTRMLAVERYIKALADVELPGIGMNHSGGNGYLLVLSLEDRDAVRAKLTERSIETGVVYPKTIADQRGADEAIVKGSMPRSRTFCERVLNLPLFFGISDDQIDEVVAALKEAIK